MEEAIRTSLRSILEDEGYEVAVASNGHEAVKLYMTDPPDLMVLDIWMPELDGLETLRRVKEFVPGAQVMMMSGHGSIETAVKAIKLGAYDYIEKPLSSEMSPSPGQACTGPIPVGAGKPVAQNEGPTEI